MNNIKKVAKYVAVKPDSDESKALLELAVALETSAPFALSKLYEVNHECFKLALGLIDDWRLDRHYLSRLQLLDHAEMQVPVVSSGISSGISAGVSSGVLSGK